ncbi:zinc-ribbon domain-containing protein [Streptomyces anulatus]|uniref:Zinc-ribbon domain-containing protein n=1 Tax=Streptomyces anulatus TaxID=1892 RepID=A0ABZ1Z7N4_STRAQ|nr:zinc-ribbon domain-containing protein [Streptomyces anulatus]
MTDVPGTANDHTAAAFCLSTELVRATVPEKIHLGRSWLRSQEQAMAEEFLEEGRDQLPVDGDYTVWRQAQQRRLGEARERWLRDLAQAGWSGLGTRGRSLAYVRPDLLDEYDSSHPENPFDLPLTASVTDAQSVWWRCLRDESHQWRTSFNNRHVAGTGCPRCGKKGVSRREQEIFTALRERLPALVSPGSVSRHEPPQGCRRLRSWRVDMLLPAAQPVAVEYDGAYWHKDRIGKDQEKTTDLMASGHIVIRIREQPLPAITPHDIICTPDQQADVIAELVHRRIVEVTPESVLAPSGDPEPAEATQLQLFPDDTPTFGVGDSHIRSQAQRIALKALMMEALLQIHTVSVNFDRTLGEHLLCGRSVRDVETVLRQDMGGLLALSHAARRTLGPIPPDTGTAHPPGQPD